VGVNLLGLAVAKYAGFLVDNLNLLVDPFGLHASVRAATLPLGISFITFHCLSYVIDVYRRRIAANRSLVEVALYIALFPQLIAGPIIRYKSVARQLRARVHTLGRASAGLRMFVIGLAQKLLIADMVAPIAELVFDRTSLPSMTDAWTALLAYSLQIYFDFAGYSNMAIGLGVMLGFGWPRNFRLPYTSRSITEFWRRWHMSLSSWLRDYLYIPLGGSYHGTLRTYRNLIAVFLLCGLWHGASWTFVAWGAWHGTFLVLERAGGGRILARLPAFAGWAYTLIVVMAGWVLFRSHDLIGAKLMAGGLIGRNGSFAMSGELHDVLQPSAAAALIGGCALAILPRWARVPKLGSPVTAAADHALIFGLLAMAMASIAGGTYSPFIYFRF
jgi:D-alanyl-lipoteichoic acid acyltransferase DltB (MBOAT superfamily)